MSEQKPYFAEGTEAMLQLEAMIDKAGLRNVLYAIEHICAAKSEHIAQNWQDQRLAKSWTFAGNCMRGTVARLNRHQGI